MRATAALACWSLRIELGASASSALAYSVASMVWGGPFRSTRMRSTCASLFGLRGGAVLLVFPGGTHRGPEPGGLTNRFLDRTRLPAQLADRLAVIDIGFGAHHPHRFEAEFGVCAGEPGPQAAQRAQRIQR